MDRGAGDYSATLAGLFAAGKLNGNPSLIPSKLGAPTPAATVVSATKGSQQHPLGRIAIGPGSFLSWGCWGECGRQNSKGDSSFPSAEGCGEGQLGSEPRAPALAPGS